MDPFYEVAVIGGSYAGLSGAMSLGRAGRQTLIIDSGRPCNRQTPHSHNLITHDGDRPADIARLARSQTLAYPTVSLVEDEVARVSGGNGNFLLQTAGGACYRSAKILLATGVRDLPMPIEGYADCWGISVLHCPYCHGYEVRNKPLAVIANGDIAFEFTRLIYQWSQQLSLLTNGPAELSGDQLILLDIKGIPVIEKRIEAFEHQDGYLQSVRFSDGSLLPLKAVFARGGTEQQGDLIRQLGCELYGEGMFKGLIKTELPGKTSIPGVYAAGDNSAGMRSLSAAMAAGGIAGAGINHEFVQEQF